MSLAALVTAAASRLERAAHPPADARRDAVLLARHVLSWSATEWLAHRHDAAPPGFADALDALVTRREHHEPVAYLTGEREFFGRPFAVSPAVLIPRPETELLVAEALARLPASSADPIADVGTGSGCVAVTIALERPDARLVATDTSPGALDVARANARRWGVADRIGWHEHSLLPSDEGPFALVAANLPYVAEGERASLPREVADYEPANALFAGADGLAAIRALVPVAAARLRPGGWLLLEIGAGQAEAVSLLLDASGFGPVTISPDLQGIPRVAAAPRPAAEQPHV